MTNAALLLLHRFIKRISTVSPTITQNWQQRASTEIGKKPGGATGMPGANADMVRRVVLGMGPDKNIADPACGARVAMNIAAVHVPSFCSAPQDGKAYKNTYDLKKTPRLEEIPPGAEIPLRVMVDEALHSVTGSDVTTIYFGAVEVNGSGIRFYGDICFILSADSIAQDTVVLTSNSYDLVRPPLTPAGSKPAAAALQSHVQDMAGLWGNHTSDMAVVKTFASREVSERRLTTGQVSEAVLDDEDYLEVLKVSSFDASNLQEARVSASDTAAEGHIGEQLRLGLCPSLAELHWRKHRRAAVKALQRHRVRTRVVTTSGRVRA
jgi:hypothetical protein